MKRGELILLAFIFLLPLASATININGPSLESYNIGDTIYISGYFWVTEDLDGFLNTKITCGGIEYPLQLTPISLKAEQESDFPAKIQLPDLVATSYMQGFCKIRLSLMKDFVEIESADSLEFKITNDLDATFNILETDIQAGEIAKIEGDITRLNGDLIKGQADIYLRYNQTKFLLEKIEIEDGKFLYNYQTTSTPAGQYFIDLFIKDNQGNEKLFEEAVDFNLIKEISVIADSDGKKFKPGQTIKITGDAQTILRKDIAAASLNILLDEKNYNSEVQDGKFEYGLELPGDIKSGRHIINITVQDEFGNHGKDQIEIEIEAVPSKLENILNSQIIDPNDVLEVKVHLLDQANENIDTTIKVEVRDPEGDVRVDKEVQSNQKILFRIPQFGIPGIWEIESSYNDYSDLDKFSVNEIKDVLIEKEDEIIKITNIGNIDYDEEIRISATDGKNEYNIKKKKEIAPNQTIIINLKKEIPSGTYDLSVDTDEAGKSFSGNVIVEGGKPVKSFNFIYILLVLTFTIILVYFLFIKGKKKTFGPRTKTPKKKLANVRKKIEFRLNSEKGKKKEIIDFRDRILNEIKKTEKKHLKPEPEKYKEIPNIMEKEAPKEEPKNKDSDNGGAFLSLFG
ncbi:MAG: hypothetical protein U9Q69_03220 [Nanoarchaeota archaeon]|nr:hypothetical protein [Nanoarchaeota archaeon]